MTALATLSAPAPLSAEGLQRSARLMRALGPDAAAIWAELTPEEGRRLNAAIDAVGDDGGGDLEVIDSFVAAHRAASHHASPRRAGSLVWTRLSALEGDLLADFLSAEHPQVIALTLSRLTGEASARLLRTLAPDVAVDAMQRLLHIGAVHPAALRVLEDSFETSLNTAASLANRSGHERIARIFDRLDSRSEQALFTALENAEPGAGEKVRALMFTFDDLASLDAGALQTLLAAADRGTLVLALKGASDITAAAFFANLTKRAGDLLREEISAQGAVRRSDVEAARQDLILLARTLIHRGEIRSGSDVTDDELVE
jgi:flagellar motor switch protein FliG